MNLKRRLLSLECRRPFSRDDFAVTVGQAEALRKLCLPLPDDATSEERAEALRLMVAAQARTRINRDDAGGWDTVASYARGLHTKYGTTPIRDRLADG